LPARLLVAVVTVRTLRPVPPGDRVRLVGLRASLTPDGAPETVSCTVPLNPPMLVAVMLSLPLDPARRTRGAGLAERTKVGGPTMLTVT